MYSTLEGANATLRSGVASCPVGSFCQNGLRELCPTGRFGGSVNVTSNLCDGPCLAGRYCPNPGTTSEVGVACGSPDQFCPAGSSSPTNVSTGYYSLGGVNGTLMTSQLVCEPGSFCVGGVRAPCAGGTFSPVAALASPCSSPCPAGYYCPPGTPLNTSFPCGSADKYCPAGVSAPIAIPAGSFSTPVGGVAALRTGVSQCRAGTYCLSGIQYQCTGGRFGNTSGLASSVSGAP